MGVVLIMWAWPRNFALVLQPHHSNNFNLDQPLLNELSSGYKQRFFALKKFLRPNRPHLLTIPTQAKRAAITAHAHMYDMQAGAHGVCTL